MNFPASRQVSLDARELIGRAHLEVAGWLGRVFSNHFQRPQPNKCWKALQKQRETKGKPRKPREGQGAPAKK